MFVFGVACACVYHEPLALCPVHKTSLVTYNKKQCANLTCKAGASGFCDVCRDRIIAIVKRAAPMTKQTLYKLVAAQGAFLPQSAVNNYKHPYTVFVYTLVLNIVQKSPVFTVEEENILLTTTVIEKRLDAMPLGFIANTFTSDKCWAEFLRSTEKYIVIGKTARRNTKYNCYSFDRLIHILQNADYEGVPLNDLYKEHPDMNQMLKKVLHFNANRRVYYHKKVGTKRHHFTT